MTLEMSALSDECFQGGKYLRLRFESASQSCPTRDAIPTRSQGFCASIDAMQDDSVEEESFFDNYLTGI
jgi:hypothetical protein